MGFFSMCCAKTQIPIMASCIGKRTWSEVVVLLPGGSKFEGTYDGYGSVNNTDLLELRETFNNGHQSGWEPVRLVLKAYYNGETYEQLGVSEDDPGQGYFHDDADIEELHNAAQLKWGKK